MTGMNMHARWTNCCVCDSQLSAGIHQHLQLAHMHGWLDMCV
jgi:hypothetical protein